MTHIRFLAAAPVAALFILGACQNEAINLSEGSDPQAEALKNAPAVQLPPSIRVAKSYRCKDNTLVYVSFMSDNVTAMVRDKQEEPPVATLKAPAPGQPFAAEGFSLSGDGDTVTYKSPDAAAQTCRA